MLNKIWCVEVKYTLLLVLLLAGFNAADRLFTTAAGSQKDFDLAANYAAVPQPPSLTQALDTVLSALQPAVADTADSQKAPADPQAGRLGQLQVSMKAVFFHDGSRKAVFRVVSATATELKTLQQGDEINGYQLQSLSGDRAVFQQGEQQVTLRLFKSNIDAALSAAEGNN